MRIWLLEEIFVLTNIFGFLPTNMFRFSVERAKNVLSGFVAFFFLTLRLGSLTPKGHINSTIMTWSLGGTARDYWVVSCVVMH